MVTSNRVDIGSGPVVSRRLSRCFSIDHWPSNAIPQRRLYQASALTASVRARSFSVKMFATLVSTGTVTPLTVALPVAAFAVLQIIVGALFAAIFLFRGMPAALHRLPFKASMTVFSLFCAGDILLGDRMELWEHGTFMILTVVTYMLFLSRYEERHVAVRLGRQLTARECCCDRGSLGEEARWDPCEKFVED
jgi:hypothetical protein